jgi:hypothetical protein
MQNLGLSIGISNQTDYYTCKRLNSTSVIDYIAGNLQINNTVSFDVRVSTDHRLVVSEI